MKAFSHIFGRLLLSIGLLYMVSAVYASGIVEGSGGEISFQFQTFTCAMPKVTGFKIWNDFCTDKTLYTNSGGFIPPPTWVYTDIPATRLSLPLPSHHEIKPGAKYPTVDVYATGFGLFIDKECEKEGCASYVNPDWLYPDTSTNMREINEAVDAQNNIRLKRMLMHTDGKDRQYVIMETIGAQYPTLNIQIFPDNITPEVADRAWGTILAMRLRQPGDAQLVQETEFLQSTAVSSAGVMRPFVPVDQPVETQDVLQSYVWIYAAVIAGVLVLVGVAWWWGRRK